MNFPYDAKPGAKPPNAVPRRAIAPANTANTSRARAEAALQRSIASRAARAPDAARAAYPARPLPVPGRAHLGSPYGAATSQHAAVSSRATAARPRAPLAMREETLRPRPAARRWPLWLAMTLSSCALVAAGYLAALVQVGARHTFVPRLISESPASSAAAPQASLPSSGSSALVTSAPSATNATNTTNVTGQSRSGATVAPPTARLHTVPRAQTQPAKVRPGSTRKLAHASLPPSTGSADVPREQPPVMTLRRLTAGESASSPAAQSSRDQPSREDVRRGMEQVRPQLAACTGGRHGAIDAQVTISGAGRVNYSVISGDFVGTPEGSCMARALRTATFPPFAGTRFKVLYPFVL
jgi:hypothetical protein